MDTHQHQEEIQKRLTSSSSRNLGYSQKKKTDPDTKNTIHDIQSLHYLHKLEKWPKTTHNKTMKKIKIPMNLFHGKI